MWPAFQAPRRALIAAVVPMLTWSSCPAQVETVCTVAGAAWARFSPASAAATQGGIMHPEPAPEPAPRHGGSADRWLLVRRSARACDMVLSAAGAMARQSNAV